jgi:hypothetical protein
MRAVLPVLALLFLAGQVKLAKWPGEVVNIQVIAHKKENDEDKNIIGNRKRKRHARSMTARRQGGGTTSALAVKLTNKKRKGSNQKVLNLRFYKIYIER